jgi:hypothetical protein
MTRKFRSRNSRNTLCLATLAGLVFASPGAAVAGHEAREERDHAGVRRQVPVYRHGDYCDRIVTASANHYAYRHSVYSCRPCSQRFETRRAFRAHLRHHHHVASWAMPFVVVHHALGWIFYG